MIGLLLALIFSLQGNAVAPTQTGTVTGVIRTPAGSPAAGVRVVVMARPDTQTGAASEVSSVSLGQTDESGVFRLENVPVGSYYVAAGRGALPTYFPGVLELSKGKVVSIAPNAIVANIDFIMDDASIRLPESAVDLSGVSGLTMPVQVRVEGSGKQPIFADGKSVMIRFTRKQDGAVFDNPLDASILNVLVPSSLPGSEYRVTVENLPGGYVVKSMIQNSVELLNETLKITAKDFVEAPIPVIGLSSPGALLSLNTGRMAYGAGGPMTQLEILLAGPSSGSAMGVRVRGRVSYKGTWDISLTGSSSVLFADRSFECRGVAPGRHVILLTDKSVSPERVLAASIVVGDKDLDDVMVDETVVLPVDIRFPANSPPPGTNIPLASIRGRVADTATKVPVLGGSATITGRTHATFPIDSEGLFQIPGLLPGVYELTIEGSNHAADHQNVVIGDEDAQLNVLVRSVN